MKFEYCIQLHFNSFNLTPKFPQNQILVILLFGQSIGRKPIFYICTSILHLWQGFQQHQDCPNPIICTGMCQKWTFVHAKHFCRGQYLGCSFAMMDWRFGEEEKDWTRFVNESIYSCSFIYIKCVGTLLTINKLMGQSLAHQLGFFFLCIRVCLLADYCQWHMLAISYVSPFSPIDNFILHYHGPLHHITLYFYFQKVVYNSKPPMLFIA
jgi:hypothetical protein